MISFNLNSFKQDVYSQFWDGKTKVASYWISGSGSSSRMIYHLNDDKEDRDYYQVGHSVGLRQYHFGDKLRPLIFDGRLHLWRETEI